MSTDFNIVWTSRTKSKSQEFIIDTIVMIKRRFKQDVVFIWSDNERSLSNSFKIKLKGIKITLEESASDTSAQNGHAEYKNKILTVKTRALQIGAKLLYYIWIEAIHTAFYLANRTPITKHSWKSFFELVTSNKPSFSHLKVYGCKAYALNHHIPKKQKLKPQAHIGYFVNYNSTNIFQI